MSAFPGYSRRAMPGPHADHWEIIGVWAERYDGIIFPVAVVSDFSIGCLFFFFLFKEKKNSLAPSGLWG